MLNECEQLWASRVAQALDARLSTHVIAPSVNPALYFSLVSMRPNFLVSFHYWLIQSFISLYLPFISLSLVVFPSYCSFFTPSTTQKKDGWRNTWLNKE